MIVPHMGEVHTGTPIATGTLLQGPYHDESCRNPHIRYMYYSRVI